MSRAARLALVTGAGRGLGRALALALAGNGWHVLAGLRRPGDWPEPPPAVTPVRLDLDDPEPGAGVGTALAGRTLDLLVHNAAVRGDTGGLATFSADGFLAVMRTNVAAPLLLTRALLPRMPPDGRIVFVSSRAGSMAEGRDPDGDLAYSASKAALNRLAVKLSETIPQTVLLIHPGWVRTDMGGPEAEIDAAESAAGIVRRIALSGPADSGRFMTWRGEPVGW